MKPPFIIINLTNGRLRGSASQDPVAYMALSSRKILHYARAPLRVSRNYGFQRATASSLVDGIVAIRISLVIAAKYGR